ncbi:MAG: DegT/DnrJ/EryC1/StrS family aminotransferase [Planctomycetia bacterium]|nr:DegT/DnrJ/EryC1/StrS family aminotransferase [Planctomycetia bacterium]
MDAMNAIPDVPVPLFDVQRQYRQIRWDVLAALESVAASGRYILGPPCQQLEAEIAAYCGTAHAVGCASGSDAVLLALQALGIGPGDEVIVPSYTFFATASAVTRLGARPVFVDIEPKHFNIDPAAIEAAITPATKAIVPVHLFGQCADMEAIAARHGIPVIDDAAQAIGAQHLGRRAGSLGVVGCFSFYPTKNLGAMGDGGMLTTSDAALAERLRLLRTHGMQPRYHHKVVGINSRLDSIQAAVLLVKMKYLDEWTARRRENAARYDQLFAAEGLVGRVALPSESPGNFHIWNQYVIRVPAEKRDKLHEHLAAHNVGTEIYYPVPLHHQPCFRELGYGDVSLPVSEQAARETIALPIFPELTAEEQQVVVGRIGQFFAQRATGTAHSLPQAA